MHDEIKKHLAIFERVLNEIPELAYAGEKVLREETSEVATEQGVEIGERCKDVLLRYRKITGYGRGLAAPQIGEAKKVFVTYLDDHIEIFINPKILDASQKTNLYRELCMSAGIVAAEVERPEWIVMEWTDTGGKKQSGRFDGFKSRLYQHEAAHLRGRLNLDDSTEGGIQFLTFDPLRENLRDPKNI